MKRKGDKEMKKNIQIREHTYLQNKHLNNKSIIISAKNLSKSYLVPKKENNLTFFKRLKRIFYRENVEKVALKNMTFNIKSGEIVGYIGPNGAGKSTTIKILTGILTPSKGSISILGFNPHKERYEYTKNIGVVFGNRRLLQYDVPVEDSFKLYKAIYEISDDNYIKQLNFFKKILGLDRYLHIPVRKLSLGERMRCEIAAALLHTPKIVFLDEPTIGLDAIAKEEIRNFLKTINKKHNTTIILTTHDMDDIESLCERVILIDDGSKLYDGNLKKLQEIVMTSKTIEIKFSKISNSKKFSSLLNKNGIELVEKTNDKLKLRVLLKNNSIPVIIKKLFECLSVEDFSVHEPRLEHLIKEIYEGALDNTNLKNHTDV